jgi:HK97 family phage prohead protease
MGAEADFSGYATKAGLRCSDGRTVTAEAFKHQDAVTVPLVWQHGHNKPDNVLGHVLLKHRNDGMYAQGFFNDTPAGIQAKELVQHKDINALSIYANELVEKAKTVLHGTIREVSLVLAGANPGALIDFVRIAHSADPDDVTTLEDEAVIHTGLELDLVHGEGAEGADEQEETKEEVEETEEETETKEEALAHADMTVQDIVDGFSDEEKNVVAYLIGQALEQNQAAAHSDDNNGEGDLEHKEGNGDMTRNVFEQEGAKKDDALRHSLSTDDVRGIISDAQKLGSLHDAVDAYAIKHGIDDIEVLFPDAQTIDQMPQFNKRRTEWVQGVLNGTRHSPFSRVKTIWADLTQADARAKGYIKGNYKIEEWFGVTKRTTDPTTIYKKQKLDRDDIVDITSFDVIAWLKLEMRMMLEEELARAVLVGDGRDVDDDDKIKDPMGAPAGDGIRSIMNDHELFVTTINVNVDDTDSSYDEVVDAVMDGMEYYKGSGTPSLYTTIRQLNKFLKAKDAVGRRLYANKAEVAAALGVDQIVTVEPMNDYDNLIGIVVNLDDYNIGADKGGEVNMFDDFDIDYNQQKYLIETRLSGGLTKIKSAIVILSTGATDTQLVDPTPPSYVASTGVITIPTVTHVVYKNADTGATLSSGAQTALAVGASMNVQALPASGYYFANDANTLWPFYRRPVPSGS